MRGIPTTLVPLLTTCITPPRSPITAMMARSNDLSQTDDLYKIIGASHDATPSELRAAFRHQARQCHPDV